MKFGETIPRGYFVEVESWENDGDNYQNHRKMAVDRKEIEVILALAPLFKSRCNNRGCFGNTCDGDVDMMMLAEAAFDKLGHLNAVDVYGVIGYDILSLDFESDSTPEEEFEKAGEAIAEYARNTMTGYSEFYDFRVVERVKVYYLKEDVIIPSVELISEDKF